MAACSADKFSDGATFCGIHEKGTKEAVVLSRQFNLIVA
jgi:hypothetical protein